MKFSKFICLLTICTFIFMCSGCNNSNKSIITNEENDSAVLCTLDEIALIPYSGYICAYNKGSVRNGQAMIQLPFVHPLNSTLDIEKIRNIHLIGDNISLRCKSYQVLAPVASESYNMSTLLFYVVLEDVGKFSVNSIKFTLSDGSSVQKELNEFIFNVNDKNNEPPFKKELKLRGSPGPRDTYDSYYLSYENVSEHDIEITGITYDERLYEKINRITLYDKNETKIENNVVLPGQRVYIRFDMDLINSTAEPQFFYQYSPFLQYTINGVEKEMAAVYSPLIIQTPFNDEYLLSLMS